MNTRWTPVVLALLALALCAYWRSGCVVPAAEPFAPDPTPRPAPVPPEPLHIPDALAIDPAPAIGKAPVCPIRLVRIDTCSEALRLGAFAGEPGLWVASIEDAGRFHTIREGDTLPRTSLRFLGIVSHSMPSGAPSEAALFFDSESSRHVEVRRSGAGNSGPLCVLSVGERESCLSPGGSIECEGRLWTVAAIEDDPPGVVLRGPAGESVRLGSDSDTAQAADNGR